MNSPAAAAPRRASRALLLLVCSTVATVALPATAQVTWTGTSALDANWSTGANWSSGAAPAAANPLVFTGTNRLTNTNDLSALTTFNGLTFDASAGSFTLDGNAITLGGDITTSGTNSQTINFGVSLNASRGFATTLASGRLIVNGPISGTGFGISKTGAGTLVLAGTNSYTGNSSVSDGTLQFGNGGTEGTVPTGTIALSGSGKLTFNYSAPRSVATTISSAASGIITQAGAGALTFSGNQAARLVANTGVGALTFSSGTLAMGRSDVVDYTSQFYTVANATITVNNSVAVVGQSFLTKNGLGGTLYLGNAVSVAHQNLLVLGGALDAVGSLQSTLLAKRIGFGSGGTDPVLQASGSYAPSALGTKQNNVGWGSNTADGGFAARSGPLTVNIASGTTLTYTTGSFTSGSFLASGRTLLFGSETSDNVVTLQNPLNLSGTTQTIKVVGNANPNNAAVLAGAISNGGIIKTGSGRLTLTGSNTYAGTTSVNDGVLRLNTVAAGSGAQSLGAGSVVNLGVAATSAGEIDYFAATSGTLDKSVFALGSGRNRIRNSGGNTLTLSGTLTKNGTILELAGGTFNVTGQITGASANSDLFINGASVTLTNANNDYNGPTYVYGGGTLTLGASNVVPSGSALLLGGTGSDTGTGTIATGTFVDTVASLTTSSLGGTVSITGSGATMGGLTTTGNLTFGAGTDTLALSLTNPTLGRYTLITYQGTRSGTFDTVTGNGDYNVVYGGASNSTIDLQLKANQATSFTLTPASSHVLVGGSTTLSGVLTNSSPTGAASLAWNPTVTGSLSGVSSSVGSTIGSGSSSTISATFLAGNTAGSQNWSIVNTDNNAITTTSTATGVLTVYDPATASFAPGATTTSLLVDIGEFNQNTGDHTKGFIIYNLFTDPSFTADLMLESITDIGSPSNSLSIDLSPGSFGDLVAGGTSNWLATLTSLTTGSFSNQYQLNFVSSKDGQSLGGPQSMTLTVTGVIIVPEPGAIGLAGIGVCLAGWAVARRRRRAS